MEKISNKKGIKLEKILQKSIFPEDISEDFIKDMAPEGTEQYLVKPLQKKLKYFDEEKEKYDYTKTIEVIYLKK